MKNKKGKTKLFVVSGLSGSGKDSVVQGLKKNGLKFTKIITFTTRAKRPGEKDGQNYHFIAKKKFKKLIRQQELLEWAEVYGNYYGQTKESVEEALKKKKPVILVIDPQGAKTIQKKFPEAKVIFLLVESLKVLAQRLKKRGQDSAAVIKRRIREAKREMKNLKQWDYVLINKENQLATTIKKVKNFILKNL